MGKKRSTWATHQRFAVPSGAKEPLLIMLHGHGRYGSTMAIHDMNESTGIMPDREEIDVSGLRSKYY
jgi:poly(3-hydroxybutyrate) depolymerase